MAVGSASYAGLVTSLPGGTVDAMPGGQLLWWRAAGTDSEATSSGALGPMAGTNDTTDSMTFALSSPVFDIGGL